MFIRPKPTCVQNIIPYKNVPKENYHQGKLSPMGLFACNFAMGKIFPAKLLHVSVP